MSDSRTMYQENILDHYRQPRHFGQIERPTHSHHGYNPLCGDDITVELVISGGLVQDVRFRGSGCAISVAATSMLTEKIKGMKADDIMNMKKEDVLEMLQIPVGPVRLKCALIGLETVQKAIGDKILSTKHQ
jgi:nitrogen fixation protein NifU and related proteins